MSIVCFYKGLLFKPFKRRHRLFIPPENLFRLALSLSVPDFRQRGPVDSLAVDY